MYSLTPRTLVWIALAASLAWSAIAQLRLHGVRRRVAVQGDAAETHKVQLEVELFKRGRRDTLTGLPSRPVFLETLAARLTGGRGVMLLVLDLHRFAAVEAALGDAMGDGIGDALLCAVADRLRGLSATRDFSARLDGDEFGLLIDEPGKPADRVATAERMMAALALPFAVSGRLIDLPLCIGLACAPDHARTAETLLRAAHSALHEAKLAGRASWRLCGEALDEEVGARNAFRSELKRAVGNGQILPWYQPIIDLGTGEIAKFEVLARWNHPTMGLLTPDRFIPVADEIGLAGQVSLALLRQVALDSAEWPKTFRFALNVSKGQVRELIAFLSRTPGEWHRRAGIDRFDIGRFDIEITEGALQHDHALARELIDTLHEHGARAGLDDFGSGTANYAFLREMPFDSIKIGKPFIRTMLDDKRSEACVLSMLCLGRGLGIEVVADGVESAAVAERLASIGCSHGQGFFYARPVPAEEVRFMLRQPGLLGRAVVQASTPSARPVPTLRLAC